MVPCPTAGHDHLGASDADCVITMLAVASGELSEAAFAAWLREHAKAKD